MERSRREKEFFVVYWGLVTTVKALALTDQELDALYAQGKPKLS